MYMSCRTGLVTLRPSIVGERELLLIGSGDVCMALDFSTVTGAC